jgi:hypothetical protein
MHDLSAKPRLVLVHEGYMQHYQVQLVRIETGSHVTFKFRFCIVHSFHLLFWEF